MVRYIGVKDATSLVADKGVERFIIGLAQYLEDDFRRWPQFEKSARIASHSANGVIELMPASDGELYGFKYVNGHPINTRRGLSTVTAFGVLSDVSTGYPLLLTEMTVLTAFRTAATSALAAKYLARKDSRVMAIIGLGAQSEFQAMAFKALLGIDKLRVFDIDMAATDKFIANLKSLGFTMEIAASAAEAVVGADIITTITADKSNAIILSDNMVGAGVHLNAVGGDCPGKTELHRDVLLRADVFVEFTEQTRIEGEIQQMGSDFPVTELWQVITGEALGRRSETQITLFDSVGFAIEDFSTLRYVYDQTEGSNFYSELDLLAAPADPKSLFSLMAQPVKPAADRPSRPGFAFA